MQISLDIQDKREQRKLVPQDFIIKDWESLKTYFETLLQRNPQTQEDLAAYLEEISELESVVDEEMAWRYIRMTCDTKDEKSAEAYEYFVRNIAPELSIYSNKLNQKVADHPLFSELDHSVYLTYTRSLQRQLELFREENVARFAEDRSLAQQFSGLIGAMSVEHEGENLTLQQAGKLLESHDRKLREDIWLKVQQRRIEDKEKLDEVLDKLIALRHSIGKEAGFISYTQYKFQELGRFDYSPEDTLAFHDAVERVVTPVYVQLMNERKERLGVERLRPWDLQVDVFGDAPLHPFNDAGELIGKTVQVLASLRPELGNILEMMDRKGFLDLESRMGKAPGGYNYPLAESGVPFIFMNATGTQDDVTTILHESGHAIHAFLTHDIKLNALKNTPSEVAELASMSMELLALDYYDLFYPAEEELKRAKKEQLLRSIIIFPWIATIDAFQQWIYDHPEHNKEERREKWLSLYYRFHGDAVDWEGYEEYQSIMWQKQLHIFEVPFYYIEYAIAQLGALAVWRNYKQNSGEGLNAYLEALKLGYKRPIPEIYEAANISFDFSASYMKDSIDFCLQEYSKLKI